MKATLEKQGAIKHVITVEAPADAVEKAFSKALEKVRSKAEIPGFRKGKVPDNVIEQRFGEELATEAIKELVRETYLAAVKEAGANPITEPSVVPAGKIEKGKPFTYKAEFEVYPEFTAKDYEGIKLEREKIEVSDEEVEAELKNLQRQMTQLEPAPEGELGAGMVALIDFKGTAAGKSFPGSEAENYVVDFGSGGLLEEFEVQIKGMKTSEERSITFTYPQDYFKKEIAGLLGEFKVKVKEVRRKIVPALDDEFAKELGKFTTLAEVRGDLKKRIGEYKESLVKSRLREAAVHDLIEKHKDLEVPTPLVEAELENMLQQLDRQLKSRGQKLSDVNIDAGEFVRTNAKEAQDRARGFMVIRAIAKQENLEVTEADFEKRLAEIAEYNKQTVEKIKEYLEKENRLEQLRAQMLFEKALDFVVDKAKVAEVKPKKKK